MQMEHFQNTSQRLHIAATISWHHKGTLQFYNDENDHVIRPRKPRKTMYQSDTEYQQLIVEWEASLPALPHGNSMTQAYYTSRLLPVYAEEINRHRIQEGLGCIFQQDNDPSHGTKSYDNLPKRLLIQNWITTYLHPAQSPDLNPIEAIWNILKQRIRQRFFDWHSIEELKGVILEEWEQISMAEIQSRITELPQRCTYIIESNGLPVKSSKW